MKKKLFIFGCGGYAVEILEIILLLEKERGFAYRFGGFIADREFASDEFRERSDYVGNIAVSKINKHDSVVLAIAKNLAFKQEMVKVFREIGVSFPNIIHPSCFIHTQDMGEGNIIELYCGISREAKLGSFNLLNGVNIMGHHSRIGDFNSLNGYVSLHGYAMAENANIFGVGSCMLPKAQIGSNNTIAPGSVIYKRFRDSNLISGNPAVAHTKNEKISNGGGQNDLNIVNLNGFLGLLAFLDFLAYGLLAYIGAWILGYLSYLANLKRRGLC